MDITINKNFIEEAKKPSSLTALLFKFADSNSHRVVKNEQILKIYNSVDSSIIKEWIILMGAVNYWKNIEVEDCSDENIFIESCKKSFHKSLVVYDYDDYEEDKYEGLSMICCQHEINEKIFPTQSVTNIITIDGDDACVTSGAHSPIKSSKNEQN